MIPEDVYSLAVDDPDCGMLDHLPLLRSISYGTVLEIGVNTGQSTAAFLLGRAEHVYSVDINEQCRHSINSPRWTFIWENSRNWPLVYEKLPALDIDVLFIDGDHSYESVRSDLKNYASIVNKEGIIILHDVINKDWPGCAKAFWEFVKETKRKFVIYSGSYGLAIIYGTQNKNWMGL